MYYIYMKHLLPVLTAQTIKILPRVYTSNIVISLRDDSTNEVVLLYPTDVLKVKNYLEITDVFNLKEGRFYDLKVYYGEFEKRVDLDLGNLESIQCLTALYPYDDLDIIYRDKIFCTIQSTDQVKNEYYMVNKDTYKPLSGNNDFIIL